MVFQETPEQSLPGPSVFLTAHQFRISLDCLRDVLNVPAEPAQSRKFPALPAIRGDIIFDRTVFRCSAEGAEVLRGISLNITTG